MDGFSRSSVTRSARGLAVLALSSLLLLGCGPDDGPNTDQSADSAPVTAPSSTPASAKQEVAPAPVPVPLPMKLTAASAAETQTPNKAQNQVQSNQDPRFDAIELAVADIRQMTYDDGHSVGIVFSAPLDASKPFADFIKVDKHNVAWHLSEDGQTLFMVGAQPSVSYQVSVSPGIAAANGTTLNRSTTETVKLGPAPASLAFASDGHVLPQHGHKGLPVYTQNVEAANISFFRVQDDKIGALRHWQYGNTRRSFYQLDDIPQFADLVYEGRFELTTEKNKRRLVNLPIQDFPALSPAGMYIAVMTRPGQFENPVSATWYSVTDLGIHLRSYGATQHILVHSLDTTEPVSGASIELINGNGSIGHKGRTNKDGSYTLRRPVASSQMLVVRKGTSVSLLPLDTAALDLSDFKLHQRPARNRELFIWSPRDLYRGGETAHFNALLRDADGKVTKAPSLKARLIRPDGQVLKNLRLSPNQQAKGYYQLSHAFANDAMTGDWRLEVDNIDEHTVTYAFKIEDFMPERLKLTFNPGKDNTPHQGRSALQLPVLGEYLYGAPAAGNRFDATFRVAPTAKPFEQWRDFHFGDTSLNDWNAEWETKNLAMDDQGNRTLNIENRWKDATTPMAIRVSGSLFETGGRSVVRHHKAIWLPGKQLVGVRPLFKQEATANGLAEFELIRTDGSKALSKASNLQVRLINQTPRYHWRYSSGQGWYHSRSDRVYTELTLTTTLDGKQPGKIQVPVKWGRYRLEITDPGTQLTTAFEFEAGNQRYWRYADNNGSSTRPDQVTLGLDKTAYDAGEVASLSVKAPAAGEALVLVEADKLLWSKRITVPAAGTKVDIPIAKDWTRHDTYISVLHLQPSDNQQRIAPTRAIGLTHLPLNRESRRLSIDLNTPEKWLPNRTVTLDMAITDANQKPVKQAWVTLAAVDVGVLSITRFNTPDPFKHFFEPRRYGVDLYDQYGHVIDFNNAKAAQLRFGGDAAMARGGDMARSEVQIVSLFSGLVSVKNGKAQVPLTLPDFNGRLRLMAVAFDDQRIGSADAEVIVAAPVVTQLSLPRFIAVGDQSSIALDVTNLSGTPLTLTVAMQADGPVSMTDQQQTLTLKHQQKHTLLYPFEATYPDSGTLGRITFNASVTGHPDYPIERQWSLISRPANPAVTEHVRTRVSAGGEVAITPEQLARFVPESLKVNATLNSHANLNPHNQLDNLLRYPYGCLEQTLSSTWPWLYAIDDKLNALNLPGSNVEKRRNALEHGMARIAKRQMSHGGYGLWSATDSYEQHWLTVYAGDFLTEAQQQGIQVDDALLDKTLKRLNDYVRGRGTLRERWSQRKDLYRFSYQSYAAYVLARHQRITLPSIRKLAASAPKPEQALPLTWLAIAAQRQGDKQLAQTLLQRAVKANREDTYIGDYGSPIRDNAVQARLLLQNALDIQTPAGSSHLAELLLRLENQLHKRHYLSTQERNSLYIAALEQEKHSSAVTKAKLAFGDKVHLLDQAGAAMEQASGAFLQAGVSVHNQSADSLGVDLLYQGQPLNPKAVSQGGVTVSRKYYDTKGNPVTLNKGELALHVGDLLVAEVVISSTEYRPDLLLVDLIPAGLELENQNLADSFKLKDLHIENHTLGHWYNLLDLRHQEYRDDRFVAAVALGNEYNDQKATARLHYLVRAVTPGRYQIPAALLEDMYAPEVRAVGDATGTLVVRQPKAR